MQRPAYDAAVNVLGTVNTLEAARAAGAQVVFSSTGGAIYGESSGLRAKTARCGRCRRTGSPKLAAEAYVEGWSRVHGTGHVVLRFANVYGPRQSPSLEGGVVAIFLRAARRAASRPRSSATAARRATSSSSPTSSTRCSSRPATAAASSTSAAGRDERDRVAPALRRGGGSDAQPSYEAARAGDARRSVLDQTRATAELGWTASTPLREGIAATLAAERKE